MDDESLMDDAKAHLLKLTEPTALRDAGHVAMLLRPKSAQLLERLIRHHEGFVTGTTQHVTQISSVASQLLAEIAKLQHARQFSRTGRTLADDFINGTAPRLFDLAKTLHELLEG